MWFVLAKVKEKEHVICLESEGGEHVDFNPESVKKGSILFGNGKEKGELGVNHEHPWDWSKSRLCPLALRRSSLKQHRSSAEYDFHNRIRSSSLYLSTYCASRRPRHTSYSVESKFES